MTKEEMLNVVVDHCELCDGLHIFKSKTGTYSVYAVCNGSENGIVEIKPKS